MAQHRFRLFPFRSPLLRESIFLSLPPATEMFQFAGFASYSYGFTAGCHTLPKQIMAGFPIRKSSGQSLFGSSPRLIAAYYVLHRLLAPRHPPYALNCLTSHPAPARSKKEQRERRMGRRTQIGVHYMHTKTPLLISLLFNCQRLWSTQGQRHMEDIGLEPTTLGLQSRCSPN